MATKTLDQFTDFAAVPTLTGALLFVRDATLSSPQSRKMALTWLMSAIQNGLTVESLAISDPTALSPSRDDAYIVMATGAGAWVSQDENVAIYNGTSWEFYTPAEGWRVYDKNTNKVYEHNGSAWAVRQVSTLGYSNTASGLAATDPQAAIDELVRDTVQLAPFASGSAVTTGNGTSGLVVPATMNGMNVTAVLCAVHDKGITGTTDVQIRRRRAGADVDVLSTVVTIGDEFFAADGVINASNDDLQTGDVLYVDVDAVHSGTAPNGLTVAISAARP